MSLVKGVLAKCDDYFRLREGGRRQMRPDRAGKTLMGGGASEDLRLSSCERGGVVVRLP